MTDADRKEKIWAILSDPYPPVQKRTYDYIVDRGTIHLSQKMVDEIRRTVNQNWRKDFASIR